MTSQLTQEDDLACVVAVVRRNCCKHLERRLAAATCPWARPTSSQQAPETLPIVLDRLGPFRAGRWCRGARPASGGMLRRRRGLTIEPGQYPVLPVDHVAEQFVECVWRTGRSYASASPLEAIKYGARGDMRVFASQGIARHRAWAGAIHDHSVEMLKGHDWRCLTNRA